MDLNSTTRSEAPFTIGIQTEWQLEMMKKFGNNNTISIDATFGTTQTRVRHSTLILFCLITSFKIHERQSKYIHII